MPGVFWRSTMLAPGPAAYVDDPWPYILNWIEEAHALYDVILEADNDARAATGGNTESRAYYTKLWELTESVFIGQASRSAQRLSSLWYTAWVDAGRPKIPRPPQQISEASIWRRKPVQEIPSAWPFFVGFSVAAVVIVWLSARKKKPA